MRTPRVWVSSPVPLMPAGSGAGGHASPSCTYILERTFDVVKGSQLRSMPNTAAVGGLTYGQAADSIRRNQRSPMAMIGTSRRRDARPSELGSGESPALRGRRMDPGVVPRTVWHVPRSVGGTGVSPVSGSGDAPRLVLG